MKTLVLVVLIAVMAGSTYAFDPAGYPFLAIDTPDPWSFLTRECTSYAAWYWNSGLGYRWYNTQPGRGSARYWDEIAFTLGYPIGLTPQIGAFIVWRGPLYAGDQWGHVAVVEAVSSDGSIGLSEMNWIRYSYSYRSGVNPADYGSYYYIYNSVPEPSGILALVSGITTLGFLKRRR